MRLIDADALKHYMALTDDGHGVCYVPSKDIRRAPTIDAVPVVRCAECKHRPIMSGVDWGQGLEFPEGSKCPCKCEDPWYDWMPADDWFCPNGERRSE